jgi:hypothetical protein
MMLPRELRRQLRQKRPPPPFVQRQTVATVEGLIVVAPHHQAKGFISAMVDEKMIPANFFDNYARAGSEALQKLARAQPFAFPSEQFLAWMGAAYNCWKDEKS